MKYLIIIFLLFSWTVLLSQSPINSYNFGETPQASMINPAYDIDTQYHFSIPILGSMRTQFVNTGFTAYDLLADNGIPFQQKLEGVIYGLGNMEYVDFNQKIDIVSIGQKLRNDIYLSYGVYLESDIHTTLPSEFLKLPLEGIAASDNTYSLKNFALQTNFLAAYHIGAQYNLSDRLSVGGRFKIYNVALDVRSKNATGTFQTYETEEGVLTHELSNIDITMQTSGARVKFDENNKYVEGFDEVAFGGNDKPFNIATYWFGKSFFTGNKGVGLDLGVVYQLSRHIDVAANINDLGVVFHTNKTQTYTYQGSYQTQGLALAYEEGDNYQEYINKLKEEFNENVPLQLNYDNYTTLRPVQASAMIQYTFNKLRSGECIYRWHRTSSYQNRVGFLVHGEKRIDKILYDAGAFYEYNYLDIIMARVNYSYHDFNKSSIGFSTVANIGKVNLYLGFPNVLGFINLAKTNYVGAEFGINIKLDERF